MPYSFEGTFQNSFEYNIQTTGSFHIGQNQRFKNHYSKEHKNSR